MLVLQSPNRDEAIDDTYLYQLCISWNTNNSPLDQFANTNDSLSNKDRINIVKRVAQDWAEPFRSFVSLIPDTTNVKQLNLEDFPPPLEMPQWKRVLLVGDALHAMSMCKHHHPPCT